MRKVLFATTNEGKIREAQEILKIVVEPVKVETDEIQTLDPIECARKKGLSAFNKVKKPIIVEDTSLFIESLNGLPGVFIDYFMDTLGNEGILKIIENQKDRRAYAQTSICYTTVKKTTVVTGKIYGNISLKAKGAKGFGWDPIFIPRGYSKTFAEMAPEEKNKISMRKKAFIKLKRLLK